MTKKKYGRPLRPGDIAAILAVLMLALSFIFLIPGRTVRGTAAYVYVGDEQAAILPLSQNTERQFSGNGYQLTVHIENGSVFVTDADCPDHVCEHTGKIDRAGAVIVCAPAGITVKIVGGGKPDADAVAG